MTEFVVDDFAKTTLGGARSVRDGKPLTPQQVEKVIAYLSSPGSGPDASSSFADYVDRKMRANPPALREGLDYIGFSGTDASGVNNFRNAEQYIADTRGKSGIIGDTPWGNFIDTMPGDHEFAAIKDKFTTFMQAEGLEPFRANYQGALQDMMWNAGSPEYFRNAVQSGRPVVAFVENAPKNRGFSNFELPVALEHPDTIVNGYPTRAFGSGDDALKFASNSAAEYQALE